MAMEGRVHLKVSFESSPTHIHVSTADLALVLDAEAVKLVEPVRNRLAIPSERKSQRIVDLALVIRVPCIAELHLLLLVILGE
jgi:hypothetical protein